MARLGDLTTDWFGTQEPPNATIMPGDREILGQQQARAARAPQWNLTYLRARRFSLVTSKPFATIISDAGASSPFTRNPVSGTLGTWDR